DDPADVTACDSYALPPLTNGDYFDAPNGGGNALSAGDLITSTQTIYVYAETGTTPNCSAENSFTVTINDTPAVDDPADVTACDSYALPPLTNGDYFDAPNGGGNALSAGDVITATTTLYVFSPGQGNCPDSEESFEVTITGFSVNINIEHETCWESDNGSVFVVIGDAELPVTVQLNNMAPMVFNTDSFSIVDLSPGNYEISVIDDMGCETNTSFSIQPGGANLGGSVDVLYSCDANLPSNTIAVTLFDSLVSNDVLYALDSTNPNDFTLSPDFVNISPGDHSLFIMDNNGCLGEIPFEVESFEPLELTLTSEYVNQITANVTGGTAPYTYYFDNNSGTDSNTYTINRSGTVTVRVVDSNGCEVFESTTMNLMEITIPNFFTPNNDGQNDFWRPRNIEQFPDIETYIFDRYGRKIWIIGPLDQGWDGTYESRPLPSGDYWYIVRLNDGTGREYVGNFTLYR
ncbi:MAG: T9SS type B sorting domain-containing protein, partial [Muricauda sp.]